MISLEKYRSLAADAKNIDEKSIYIPGRYCNFITEIECIFPKMADAIERLAKALDVAIKQRDYYIRDVQVEDGEFVDASSPEEYHECNKQIESILKGDT